MLSTPTVSASFVPNRYGHAIFKINGSGLTGAEEINLFFSEGYFLNSHAVEIFKSSGSNGYNARHRLIAGQEYGIVLMPGDVIVEKSERTTENLRNVGMRHYGYGEPFAGMIPPIRRKISNEQMKEMNIWAITVLHCSIADHLGDSFMLRISRGGSGQFVVGYYDTLGNLWSGDDMFAFPFPLS